MYDHCRQTNPAHLSPALKFADNLQPQPLKWLWPGRIPLAKLTLLIGDPGVGKSMLVADIAARASTFSDWPDARDPTRPKSLDPTLPPLRGGVILYSPEDDHVDTLLPRLTAAGAALEAICILTGVTPDGAPQGSDPSSPTSLLLPTHTPALQQAVRSVDFPRLLVIDPLHAALEPAAQAGGPAMARALADLAQTARSYNIAVLAVCHLSKASTHRILYRVRGSLNLITAARAAHLLTSDPDAPSRRILSPLKSLYGPPPQPLTFTITDAPRLDWQPSAAQNCGTGDSPVRNLPLDHFNFAPDTRSALADACDWLADALAAGPRPVSQLLRDAHAAAHSRGSLRRAKRALSVRSIKPDNDTPWLWTLEPAHAQTEPQP